MNKFVVRQSFILLLTATIWGIAFVAQSVGMDYVGPFTFNTARNLIGTAVLIPCIYVINGLNKKKREEKPLSDDQQKKNRITLICGGVSCGIILFIASSLQQFGIQYTTVGKAGFITAMYIVLVPVFGIFFRKKTGAKVAFAVVMAVFGLYLLCMTDGSFSLQVGDLLVLACAVAFTFHILVIDHFSPLVDGVKMSCIQFFTCSILSAVGMIVFEEPNVSAMLQAWKPILYAGALSSGVAYTLQIVGQKGMNPTVASLILSLESVISVLAGWLILGQKLSPRELTGCAIVFAAIILVQLPKTSLGHKRVGRKEKELQEQ